jgi:hypothetical protein
MGSFVMDDVIYMVTYEGQWDGKNGTSPFTWYTFDFNSACRLKSDLERKYPDRVWSIDEKDVS